MDSVSAVSPAKVTQLLTDWAEGNSAALTELTPLVYEDLRRLAHHYMSGQRPDHALQATALVNEAYLRMADQTNPSWQNRAHFIAVAHAPCVIFWSITPRRRRSPGTDRELRRLLVER